jgi:uncharacterized protein YlbG (UPF0298 family)
MKIDRKALVVYFSKRDLFLSRLKSFDINIIFISKANNYLVFYYDFFKEKDIKNRMMKIEGFISFEESYILNKEVVDFEEE